MPDTAEPTKRLALFYDESIPPATTLKNQIALIDLGYEVATFLRPRKLGKAIDKLANDGFRWFADLRTSQSKSIASEDIRPIM